MELDLDNPYAAPETKAQPAFILQANAPLAIVGDALFVPNGATLPALSVKSGLPIDGLPIVKTFHTSPSWLGFVAFISPPLALLLYYCLRRKVTISYYLEEKVRSRAKWATCICWLLFLGGIAALIQSFAQEDLLPLGLGLLLMVLAAAIYFAAARPIYSRRVERDHVLLAGIPADIMALLVVASGGNPAPVKVAAWPPL